MSNSNTTAKEMEAFEVISKIEEPTEWCSPIFVAPNPMAKFESVLI